LKARGTVWLRAAAAGGTGKLDSQLKARGNVWLRVTGSGYYDDSIMM
jgi:hypothetical protein